MANTIIEQFMEQVKVHKDDVALLSEKEGKMTYGDLDMLATKIAIRILKLCPKEKLIGVYINRTFSMIAAILGILKAGKGYMPLDTNYPIERILFCCENSDTKWIICDRTIDENIEIQKIWIDDLQEANDYPINTVNVEYKGANIAYVLYTSGSSGMPKGVKVANESIMNTLRWRMDYYNLTANDVVVQIPSIAFDSSVEDIFSTLLSGGKLLIIENTDLLRPKKLAQLIEVYEVTHFIMVPSLYKTLLKRIKPGKLRFIVLAGESVGADIIEEHNSFLKSVPLYVEYGLTETCVNCSVGRINHIDYNGYIGHTIQSMKASVVNADSNGVGELLVYGPGISDGYISDNEDNKRFFRYQNEKAVLTGDFVKIMQNGDMIYVGRKDSQVKINGQRVNLKEIDYVVRQIVGVSNSVSVVLNVNGIDRIICVVEGYKIEEKEVRDVIKRQLPVYYLPTLIFVKKRFDYLPSGKVDIQKMKNDIQASLR